MDPHEFEVILMYILNSKTKEKEVTAFVTVERCCWHPACVGPKGALNRAVADRPSAYNEEQRSQ